MVKNKLCSLSKERKQKDTPVHLCRRALEELMCLDEDAQETREEKKQRRTEMRPEDAITLLSVRFPSSLI